MGRLLTHFSENVRSDPRDCSICFVFCLTLHRKFPFLLFLVSDSPVVPYMPSAIPFH